ncbi:DUF2569 domain-containing protein [Aliiglaciecola sp. CAU 1673]|uniref:DUF2569 domain-containing protein n=1 Tax=Aliiglaciecola sp. CAU 1673 TaxID=3032595 RepID=UPI0023DCCAD2|nr:DUF2569 domain-containing protein [Aliiglaciecola sp. CAU 1673]MDF2179068.1 DUF2569 domain-containing protein [Aliiglaciecola sp. CAU 1673]
MDSPDYGNYTPEELYQALSSIDKEAYPENYRRLKSEWAKRSHLDAQPAPEPEAEGGPWSIGGWLILVGFGICVGPVRLLLALTSEEYLQAFSVDVWRNLTDPDSPAYRPLYGPLFVTEVAANLLILLLSLLLIYLFFWRKKLFPRLYAVLAYSALVFTLLSAKATEYVFADVLDRLPPLLPIETLLPQLVACFVWVPYMFFSERAQKTFVH